MGATGTIGKHVVAALHAEHDIVTVGSTRGDHQVDIKEAGSIRKLFGRTGRFDALISCVGKAHVGDFATLTENEVMVGMLPDSAAKLGDFFGGHETVPGSRIANAYVKSVEGRLTGQVFRVGA